MTKRAVLRQGDVLLEPTSQQPSAQAKRVHDAGRVILAYGEVTGHAHEVIAATATDPDRVPAMELFEEPDGTRLLVVREPVALQHQEHAPIELAPGGFKILRQCEWDLEHVRQVAD